VGAEHAFAPEGRQERQAGHDRRQREGQRDEDPRRYALFALNSILGGGTSSRLFQEVRDKRGLAYSTYSFPGLYHEGGLFGMYAGCSPADAANVTALMEECLEAVAGGGVGSAEVETAYRRVRADVPLRGRFHGGWGWGRDWIPPYWDQLV